MCVVTLNITMKLYVIQDISLWSHYKVYTVTKNFGLQVTTVQKMTPQNFENKKSRI